MEDAIPNTQPAQASPPATASQPSQSTQGTIVVATQPPTLPRGGRGGRGSRGGVQERGSQPLWQGVAGEEAVEEHRQEHGGGIPQAVSLALRLQFDVRLHSGKVCLWRQEALGLQRRKAVKLVAISLLVCQHSPVPSGPLRHRTRE